jgi:hypothetical protein
MDWLVCFKVPAETQDDRKEKEVVVATFRYPTNAEDFIEKCMPAETKERFYIRHK